MTLSPAQKITLLAYFGFWDRFIYYGTFTLLVLYLTEVQHLSEYATYGIWGIFAVLGFTTPLIGGIIGDRWLSRGQSILIGSIGLLIGCLILVLFKAQLFLIGLSCILCGMGLLKTNLATTVGAISKDVKSSSSATYNFYFIGMVLGAMAGPAIFGIFVKHQLWYSGFLVSGIGALTMTLISVFFFKFKFFEASTLWIKKLLIPIVFCVALFLIYLLFKYSAEGQIALGIFIAVVLLYLAFVCFKTHKAERLNVLYLFLLSLFCLAHLLASFQTDGSFTSFIQNHLNHTVWGWTVPTLEFSSIEPFTAVILSPLLGWLWIYLEAKQQIKIAAHTKILLATISSMAAFFLMSHAVTIWYLIASNILIGIADALIIPTMMSAVNHYSPKGLKGTLMGVWFMADALAGLLAGLLVRPLHNTHALMSMAQFHHVFLVIFGVLLATVILILGCMPWLRKMLSSSRISH